MASGRVLHVNVSRGGVPKRPVAAARVGRLGLEGDRHRETTVHGGPHRAVCLFGIEAIERVAAEGHPIGPGTVGENLTTAGIDLSTLEAGTRLAVGEVLLELTTPASPCDTIAESFADGQSGRISILRHAADSRMYARVLRGGTVRPGDPIEVEPPATDSDAALHVRLDVLDAVERHGWLAVWTAARRAGLEIDVLDDGELAGASCPAVPDDVFNRGLGLRQLPNLLDRLLARPLRTGTPTWLAAAEPPWPGAMADGDSTQYEGAIDAALAATAAGAVVPAGLIVRPVSDPADLERWVDVLVTGFDLAGAAADAWRRLTPFLAAAPGERLFLAELDGRPVGTGALFTRRKVGLLAAAAVVPELRGRGIGRALIAARVRAAATAGCEAVFATAERDGPSARNLERSGLVRRYARWLWRFDPVADRERALAAADEAVGAAR